MLAVGMLFIWGGYDLSLFGWCLFRDYNVTFGQLSSPLHPYSGAWPPAKIPAGQTWPGKAAAAASASAGGTAGGGPGSTIASDIFSTIKGTILPGQK